MLVKGYLLYDWDQLIDTIEGRSFYIIKTLCYSVQ